MQAWSYLCEADVETCVECVINSNLEVRSEQPDTSSAGRLGVILLRQELLGVNNAVAVLAGALLVLSASVLHTSNHLVSKFFCHVSLAWR